MLKTQKIWKSVPLAIALIAFILFSLIISQYSSFRSSIKEKELRDKILDNLIARKALLEKAISSRIYFPKGIAAYCAINKGITNEFFYQMAGALMGNDTVINSMALSKDCIIGIIFPNEGHESAIGLNLLEHPKRRSIVKETIKTRKTFMAGPVELIEGGTAFISYTPIFLKGKNDSLNFWGVCDIVIMKDRLFNEAGLKAADNEFQYALKGEDGKGESGACFWGDSAVFKSKPVKVNVLLPTGSWVIACSPLGGWQGYIKKADATNYILYLGAFVISALIGLLTRSLLKIKAHELELSALFHSMQDLIIVFNGKGEYLKIAPTNEELLIRRPEEMVGKTLFELLDKSQADFFLEGITRCIRTRQLVTLDYMLNIKGVDRWFHARISYISEDQVIFVSHENTMQKEAENQLRASEQQLKELNATKDRLFSIISHDLRGAFSGFLGITDELSQNIGQMEKHEISEMAGVMNTVAANTYDLLTNLLEWSRLQIGGLECIPELLNLYAETEKIKDLFNSSLIQKKIKIENSIDPAIYIFADKNIHAAVMRNLVSNAIKFSYPGSNIVIKAEENGWNASVSITDKGVGMSHETIGKIFKIGSGFSSRGTIGERGTGLGLALCKELVEKNQGEINVASLQNEGTTITFTVPLFRSGN